VRVACIPFHPSSFCSAGRDWDNRFCYHAVFILHLFPALHRKWHGMCRLPFKRHKNRYAAVVDQAGPASHRIVPSSTAKEKRIRSIH